MRIDQWIKRVLQKSDLAWRMMNWSIELSQFDVRYEPRSAIKAQAMVDFLAEMMHPDFDTPTWKLHLDGASNIRYGRAGLILIKGEDTEVLIEPTVMKPDVPTFCSSTVNTWMNPICVSQSLLKCLNDQQTIYVLPKVHESYFGHHLVEKLLAQKVVRAGYYWPTLIKDAMKYVKKCDRCQQHSNLHQAPPHEFVSIIPTRPFAKWGLDLLGPFPQGFGQVKYLIVAIDYFTK
ncbi:uncharacterized protein LOC107481513 [Arachis duranensis]|uniref:Uncharacterized protein LOC107481513 n=1 Tax=Arachis duranensis TaxID=130453 RepID=A0A6P4CUH3_ARADU|nr:uncharacterized protein LOC107481513 [Arachis duranensis]